MTGPAALNDDPFVEPAFLAGLEAAGYLQRLDTSEARITARYQHALTKMKFAAHSEEFLGRAGVKKVHRSTVQFFNEDPVADPFVHVLVGSLPPSRQELITPRGCETTGWTPIECPDEADGTIHFTMSHPGFWPVTVVFDCNSDVTTEDKYSGIRAADDSESDDAEGYLPGMRSSRSARGYSSSAYGGYGAGASSSRARSSSRGRRDAAGFYTGGMGGSQYGGDSDAYGSGARGDGYSSSRGGAARQNSYMSGSGRRGGLSGMDDSISASDSEADLPPRRGSMYGGAGGSASGRRNSYAGSRRGSMSAGDINAGLGGMSLSRSASRSSMRY
ncbi:hypothetical protein JCM10908_004372 [Rhodotorula pacifica]|uniref:uncharacterized protein n=1 Tax=Rhodotorula pacifica TaxID=1495444 RepID=UPI00316BC776